MKKLSEKVIDIWGTILFVLLLGILILFPLTLLLWCIKTILALLGVII